MVLQEKFDSVFEVNDTDGVIEELVEQASKIVPLVWPLKNYIASNPLKDLEDLRFDDALAYAIKRLSCQKKSDPLTTCVNRELTKWCQAFLDEGQASIPLPEKEQGFYKAWTYLALYDKRVHRHSISAKKWLSVLPPSPQEAIRIVLANLQIPEDKTDEFLSSLLAQLPGWAGYIKWASSEYSEQAQPRASLVDFLAVRLSITWSLILAGHTFSHDSWTSFSDELNEERLKQVKVTEASYHAELISKLRKQAQPRSRNLQTEAQFVFCIDVRSESIRKQIEQVGSYETFGGAGFFGLPISIKAQQVNKGFSSCPVLLKPKHEVQKSMAPSESRDYHFLSKFKRFYHSLKYNFVTPFTLVETLGGLAGFWMGAHVLAPKKTEKVKKLSKKISSFGLKEQEKTRASALRHAIPLEEQVSYAESILKLIGLTKDFSPLVALCGHKSVTENNPYASSLDCGACGGNGGGANARVLAGILNTQEVREALVSKGISIPSDTYFIGAEHNTTTDEISFYAEDIEQETKKGLLLKVEQDVHLASIRNRKKRSQKMQVGSNQSKASERILKKSLDWSETRPEWGLAGNAAFIIGNRQLTAGLDLDSRCFLHSYDHQADSCGSLLESILTAPVVVAQWINSQYFFSSFDQTFFGAGSKVTHNVVGKIGVMQGNASDLMFGLPLQSVKERDDKSFHKPMRLLVVVQAPIKRVENILASHKILQNIFYNEWSKMTVLDPDREACYRLSNRGDWNLLS